MDIHVDIRGFLEIHARICYGFSDQGASVYINQETYIKNKIHSSRQRSCYEAFSALKKLHATLSSENLLVLSCLCSR